MTTLTGAIESLIRDKKRNQLDGPKGKAGVLGSAGEGLGGDQHVVVTPTPTSNAAFIADFTSGGSFNVIVTRDASGAWVRLSATKVATFYGTTITSIPKGKMVWTGSDNQVVLKPGNKFDRRVLTAWDAIYDTNANMGMEEVLGACMRGTTLIVVGFIDNQFVLDRPIVIRYSTDPLVNKASHVIGVGVTYELQNSTAPASFDLNADNGIFAWRNLADDTGGIVRISLTDTTASFTPEALAYVGIGKVQTTNISDVTTTTGDSTAGGALALPIDYNEHREVVNTNFKDYDTSVFFVGYHGNTEVTYEVSFSAGGAVYSWITDLDRDIPISTPASGTINVQDPINPMLCVDQIIETTTVKTLEFSSSIISPTLSVAFAGDEIATWKVYPGENWDDGGIDTFTMYSFDGDYFHLCGEAEPSFWTNPAMPTEVVLAGNLNIDVAITAECDRSTHTASTSLFINLYEGGVKTVLSTIVDSQPGQYVEWVPGSGQATGSIDSANGGYYNVSIDAIYQIQYDVSGVESLIETKLTGGDFTAATGVANNIPMSNENVILVDPDEIPNLI